MKRVTKVYVVRVWGKGGVYNGKTVERSFHEQTVTSMREAIALTWGLSTDWEVIEDRFNEGFDFVGNEEYIRPSNKAFARRWKHNCRAFKQTLRKAATDHAIGV